LDPFYIQIQFDFVGTQYKFYQNMTCADIQKMDPMTNELVNATKWSVDKDQVSSMTKVLTERIDAFTQGKDGSDSNNWFFNYWL